MIDNQDEIRNNIIQVARNIFKQYGYSKTTMDDIAKAARKGKSTIYYYYKSKEEIFQAVVENEAQTLKSKLISIISENVTPQEKLTNYLVTRIKLINNFSNFFAAVKTDDINHLQFVKPTRTKYENEELTLVKMIIMEGIQQKVFNIDDIDLVAESFVTILRGIEMLVIIDNHRIEDIEPKINKIMGILFNGLLKR